jgi:DNA-binding transcriptional ArsR family regulator
MRLLPFGFGRKVTADPSLSFSVWHVNGFLSSRTKTGLSARLTNLNYFDIFLIRNFSKLKGAKMDQPDTGTLLQFFKALANENRLKVLGLLAQRECSVEELATLLELKAPTASHHLSKLKAVGLITMRTDGNDHLYRLDVDNLHAMAKNVFTSITTDKVVSLAEDVEYEAWERKVLEAFLDGDQIIDLPSGYKKRLVILKWLINYFKRDKKYTEKEVNQIIQQHHQDSATIRRAFISNGLMAREGGGGKYWRIQWQMPELK